MAKKNKQVSSTQPTNVNGKDATSAVDCNQSSAYEASKHKKNYESNIETTNCHSKDCNCIDCR